MAEKLADKIRNYVNETIIIPRRVMIYKKLKFE